MKALALIPARGGSRRLPRKNVAELLGRPLLAWTVEAALASSEFEQVVVSTEDAEIAAAARQAGAEVDARAPGLAGDRVGVVDVCLDWLERLAAAGRRPPTFCCLLATAALRTASDIQAARALLEPGRCEFVMAVTEYGKSPLQALRREADGRLRLQWPELLDRPDAPRLLVDNGSTYWVVSEAFVREKTFYGSTLRGYEMPRERSVDVDTPADLDLLRLYAGRRRAQARA